MTRGVWAGLAACAIAAGCTGPQYYTAPPDTVAPDRTVDGVSFRIVDQRPEWEKKPFTGVVCLYHLGKAHPDAWTQLADETNAVVGQMPQKPERVEVTVQSFRLVRSADSVPKYRDLSAGPNANPQMQLAQHTRANAEQRDRTLGRDGGSNAARTDAGDGPPNKVAAVFASKDDPRRALAEHPAGASCRIQVSIKLTFAGGEAKTIDFTTMSRAPNDSSDYYGQAMDNATKAAVIDYGNQFRKSVGLRVN